jgi:ornithine carbamoyltransferase
MKTTHQSKEETLLEALPYIQRYEGKTFVVKYGGAAMTDTSLREEFAKDITLLQKIGIRIVLVHGGGPAITELEQKLGNTSTFVGGLRYTDEQTIKAVLMSLAGLTNKELVHELTKNGAEAMGLSGIDASLLTGKRKNSSKGDLGLVGEITTVNTTLLEDLVAKKIIPVIAPVACGENGDLLNVNADEAASAIAIALGAEKLFFISDTNGVQVDGEVVPTLTQSRAEQYIINGIITGGMIPKVRSGFEALDGGVKKVHIIVPDMHSMLLEIFTNEGVGTQIINDEYPLSEVGTVAPTTKHLLNFSHLGAEGIYNLFHLATTLQKNPAIKPLTGKSIGVLFQKPSLRTRVSFEVGISELGGVPVILNDEAIGLGKRESVSDVGKVLERYCDGIVARVFEHSILEGFAQATTIPVVNALSDLSHPCQILADAYTIYQKGLLKPGVKIAFIGDGNNVANSWIELAHYLPIDLWIACPTGYEPPKNFLKKMQAGAAGTITITTNPLEAATDATVLYTDVWTSMGQESENKIRKLIFKTFQINEALLQAASSDCVVMHCLPAHRGEEITDGVLDSERSIVFDQAENRLHIQKAVLAWLYMTPDRPLFTHNYEQTTSSVPDQGNYFPQSDLASRRSAERTTK